MAAAVVQILQARDRRTPAALRPPLAPLRAVLPPLKSKQAILPAPLPPLSDPVLVLPDTIEEEAFERQQGTWASPLSIPTVPPLSEEPPSSVPKPSRDNSFSLPALPDASAEAHQVAEKVQNKAGMWARLSGRPVTPEVQQEKAGEEGMEVEQAAASFIQVICAASCVCTYILTTLTMHLDVLQRHFKVGFITSPSCQVVGKVGSKGTPSTCLRAPTASQFHLKISNKCSIVQVPCLPDADVGSGRDGEEQPAVFLSNLFSKREERLADSSNDAEAELANLSDLRATSSFHLPVAATQVAPVSWGAAAIPLGMRVQVSTHKAATHTGGKKQKEQKAAEAWEEAPLAPDHVSSSSGWTVSRKSLPVPQNMAAKGNSTSGAVYGVQVSNGGMQGSSHGGARGKKVWGFLEQDTLGSIDPPQANSTPPSKHSLKSSSRGSSPESVRASTSHTEEVDIIVPKRQSGWAVRRQQLMTAQARAEAEAKQLQQGTGAQGGRWFA